MVSVASVFCGCGGSSLGYARAGLRVAYALDIDPAACAAYALNHAGTALDVGDTRLLTAEILTERSGLPAGELVLDFSSPCGDFSTNGPLDASGLRAALHWEVPRLVGEALPRAFVSENVTGLATIGRMRTRHFQPVLAELRGLGYRVAAKTLRAEWLGVPQTRARVVVVGLRGDVRCDPTDAFPEPTARPAAIGDALPDASRIVALPALHYGRWRPERTWPASGPGPTLTTAGAARRGRDSTGRPARQAVRPLSAVGGASC